MARAPKPAVEPVEAEAIASQSVDKSADIDRAKKIRGSGDRAKAVAFALEKKLAPPDVPFIEGYALDYAMAGLAE